jgi:hypothetical protein
LLQNGGDPFLKNKNGESIETYLKDRGDFKHLKILVEEARIKKSSDIAGKNNFIHKAVEDGSLRWLAIYSALGGNFYCFNEKGERPIDVAIGLDNADIMLYVLNQSQRLLEDQNFVSRVIQFLKIKVLEQKINKSQAQKYKTLWNNLIEKGAENGDDTEVLREIFTQPVSK